MSNESSRNKEKRGLFEYLTEKTELPSDLLAGGFRLELRGRNQLYMHGCRRILKYSAEEMALSAKGFSVSVKGKRLICSAFYGSTVCIEGVIESFEINDGKAGETN